MALPVCWIVAELRGSPGVRRLLGVATILWSFGVPGLTGTLTQFNANSYFTASTKDLLEASVQQLRAGRSEVVLREWARADEAFVPTYENRGRYALIDRQAIDGMTK